MPVWIPWLKVNAQAKGGGGHLGSGGGGDGKGGNKGWSPGWGGRQWIGGGKWGGKGGKGGGWGQRRPPQTVPETFTVNPDARYSAQVRFYRKFNGYGFVNLTQKGIVPEDSVYVHWRSIQTEDRFPHLVQGMDVEVGIMKVKDRRSGAWTLKARAVTMPGGQMIAVQDEMDARNKQFVGGQHLRYTGHLQFFNPRRGFGWLTLDDGYALTEPVPKEMRVDLPEVNAGGKQPPWMRDIAVEFGIVKGRNGGYKGYNMTLPGGIPMTQEGLEHRVVLGTRTFAGSVEMYSWTRGWGFIKPATGVVLPPNVIAKIKFQQEDAMKRGKKTTPGENLLYFRKDDVNEGVEIDQGRQVTYKVYTDDKGAGACEIQVPLALPAK